MGKLHKLRHEYNQLTPAERQQLLTSLDSYWTKDHQNEKVEAVVKKYKYPYRYYLYHLLRLDGFMKKPIKIVQRVSKLYMRHGNTFTI